MNKRLIGYISLVFIPFICYSQNPIKLTIKQYPKLVANAGNDAITQANSDIKLGGTIVAEGGTGTYTYYWSPQTYLDNQYIERPTANKVSNSIRYILYVSDQKCWARDTIDILIDPKFKIFPLPAQSILNLDFPEFKNNEYTVKIYDMLGNIIYMKQYHSNKIIIITESFQKGIYILKISNHEINKTVIISKI